MSSSTTRPASRGSFELHVQSVRAARGLPHLVAPTAPAPAQLPPPSYVPSLPGLPVYTGSSDEKSTFEHGSDAGSITITYDEKKSDSESHRTTTNDGPEPKTLARALFQYGFLMPLFWFFGAAILFMDLAYHQTPAELAEDPRTPDERKADLAVLRRAEVRWAWRSLYAIVLLLLTVTITLLVWAGATGRFTGVH